MASGLGATLLEEIAQTARARAEESVIGKGRLGRRAVAPFPRMRDKLAGLAFLDRWSAFRPTSAGSSPSP